MTPAPGQDDATLAALREALTATPDNDTLRLVVFRALAERTQARQAVDLLHGRDIRLADDDRRRLAQLWLAAIFAKARAATPSVLFFDELEGLAAKRKELASVELRRDY